MFRHYLAAALGNLARNKLQSLINLLGRALGFAVAILIGLYIRDELSFNRFLPDYQQTYRLQVGGYGADGRPGTIRGTPHEMAAAVRALIPEIEATARMAWTTPALRRDTVEANEGGYIVDPGFLEVLRYPLLRGDPATVLAAPDGIVLAHKLAIKYFGTDNCLGETLELLDRDRQVLRVTGVLADPPPTSTIHDVDFLISSSAPFTWLNQADRTPTAPANLYTAVDVHTFVRLKPGIDGETLRGRLTDFAIQHYLPTDGGAYWSFLAPITSLHLHARELAEFVNGTDLVTLSAIATTGALVLVVAGINFVNLVTARAGRRAVEVGVRKAAGATRRQLILQFMSESLAYALIALALAIAAVELALPRFNAFLDRSMRFDYWREPALLAALIGLAGLVGLVAGIYPALILSRYRPAMALKGGSSPPGSGRLRAILVILQYGISIGLIIATGVIYQQTRFASDASLHFDKDLVAALEIDRLPPVAGAVDRRDPAMVELLTRRLEAVTGVTRVGGSESVLNEGTNFAMIGWMVAGPDSARHLSTAENVVDFGFFEAYGIRPLAGRSFDRGFGIDRVPVENGVEGAVIINEAAVRAFGFASSTAAIGQEIEMRLEGDGAVTAQPRRIVGVVPDFPTRSIRIAVPPTAFFIAPDRLKYLSIKLDGTDVPRTLAAIDRVWRELMPDVPVARSFIDQRVEMLYRNVARQSRIFAGFALIAVVIACLGLFGLAAFTAERRTKEIGIRKAMGASTRDILKLLIWEFAKPVLLANAIAWPLAYVVMSHWLGGFAYRISLDPLLFVG
ncbi:MAG TPA: ABC transporter permease, partial [Aliidongia sp.]|nr:ABC transporter permease [Aliidongia sp.]